MSATQAELNQFLMGVERKALRMATLAVSDTDDAMDIVQDSMLTLARKYARRSPDEWRPLFFRILQNRIRDCYRRRATRGRIIDRFVSLFDDHEARAAVVRPAAPAATEPQREAQLDAASAEVAQAVSALPLRQQQAFLLRAWEGLSVAETAAAMRCSQGSVKTHYSRALTQLRAALGEHWP